MRIFFVIFSFLFFSANAYCQQEYTLIGSLVINGGAKYTYKLVVKDSAGMLSGYSVTDIGGTEQTKCAVKGILDEEQKDLSFHETRILQTKSAIPRDSFCYIYGALGLKGIKKGKLLNGNFTAYRRDRKTVCAKGKLVLVSATDIMQQIARQDPGTDSALKAAVTRWKSIDTMPANIVQLTAAKPFGASYEHTDAIIEVWDDQHIDGDVITITLNNKPVLDSYMLARAHKTVNIRLSGSGADTIALAAISEGSEPSNTAMVKITSGKDLYYLKASAKPGERTYIILKPKGR